MKKIVSCMALAIISACFLSCEKDAGKLPNISFKGGSIYTGGDFTTDTSHTLVFGIVASKAEDKDVLKTFDASRSYDGGASVSIQNTSLSGSQGDNYSTDVTVKTRNIPGTEKYTFTVVNRDGLKNTITANITVHY